MTASTFEFPNNPSVAAQYASRTFLKLVMQPIVLRALKDQNRVPGGYLTIADMDGAPLLIVGLGVVDMRKKAKYLRLSQEKARRLAREVRENQHVLSRQSRNPERNQWSGAVAGNFCIASFSGLPEDLDEVFAAVVLRDSDGCNNESVLREHGNEWVDKINFSRLSYSQN